MVTLRNVSIRESERLWINPMMLGAMVVLTVVYDIEIVRIDKRSYLV